MSLPSRSKAISLYRQLLRAATKMPTPNRQNYILSRVRDEYKANMNLTNPKDIEFCIKLADTNLDTILVQAEHLTRLFNDANRSGGDM